MRTLLSLAVCLPLLVGCSQSNTASTASVPTGCSQASSPCLQGKANVELTTTRGVVKLELDGDAAPVNRWQFCGPCQKRCVRRDGVSQGDS